MKISHLFSMSALTAAVLLTGLTSAHAETFSGKVLGMTKDSKGTVIEIAPDNAGNPPSYRCVVSTTFQEIADMLLQAMESGSSVSISTSDNCNQGMMRRECGSVSTVEIIKKEETQSQEAEY